MKINGKEKAVFLVLAGLLVFAGLASATDGGYLELPTDYSQPATVYIDPGEDPNMNHLTQQEAIDLVEWLKVKGENSKAGDVMIVYREKNDAEFSVYTPRDFEGDPQVSIVGQEISDGRLTLKVTGVKRDIYTSLTSSGLPYEFIATCVLSNPGSADIKVKFLTYCFIEANGEVGPAVERHRVKQEGNMISEETEAEVYKPGSNQEIKISSSGTCVKLNNLCLKVSYEDGKETMFAIFVPAEVIIQDK